MMSIQVKVLLFNQSTAASRDTAHDVEWEALVSANQQSGFMQSLGWAEFKHRQGLNVVHFMIFDAGQLMAGSLGYFSARTTGARLLVSPDGPVMPWEDQALAAKYLRHLDGAVQKFCLEQKLSAWRIEPRLILPLPAVLKNFSPAPIDLLPKETLYLDIAEEIEEGAILAGMHHKARYNIKLSQRHGVRVFEDSSDLGKSSFYKVMAEASQRDCFFLEPPSFFEDLIDHLGHRPIVSGEGHRSPAHSIEVRILLAQHEGETIGGLMLLVQGSRATYLYGGIINQKRHLMAGYLLQWQAILLARSLGARTYDFYGFIEQADPSHLYCQFSQFKKKFGGRPVRFCGAREQFFMDTLADAIVRAFKEINFEEDLTGTKVALEAGNTLTMIKGD